MVWWLWGLLGFGCFLFELLLPAFILIWLGFAAFVVMGLVLLIDLSLSAQLFVWTVLSLILIGVWWRFFKAMHHKSLIGRSSAHVVGEEGLIIERVAPFVQGKIRFQKPILGSDTWVCVSEEPLETGCRAKVSQVEGSIVSVVKSGEKT